MRSGLCVWLTLIDIALPSETPPRLFSVWHAHALQVQTTLHIVHARTIIYADTYKHNKSDEINNVVDWLLKEDLTLEQELGSKLFEEHCPLKSKLILCLMKDEFETLEGKLLCKIISLL